MTQSPEDTRTPRTDAIVNGPRPDGTYGEKRDLITLARQLETELSALTAQVERLEKERDAERERCAKVCDQKAKLADPNVDGETGYYVPLHDHMIASAMRQTAAAIRALPEKQNG